MNAPSVKSAVRVGVQQQPRRNVPVPAPEEDDFSASETLKDGWRAWLSQLPVFAGCALIVHVPLLAFAFLPAVPEAIAVAAFVVAAVAAAGAAHGALAKAVLDGERNLSSDLPELLEAAAANAARSIALHVTVVAIGAAKLLLFVPGVRWLCDTFVAVPALVMEPGSMARALQRSTRLADGARPRIFVIALVPWTTAALVGASSGVFGGASFDSLPWLLAFIFARALDTSLAATMAAITYSRLRDRPGA
jgi:hypothetical protein